MYIVGYGYSTDNLFNGNQDLAPLVYDGFTCTGLEGTLFNCTIADYGTVDPTCTTVAGVMCAGMCFNLKNKTKYNDLTPPLLSLSL